MKYENTHVWNIPISRLTRALKLNDSALPLFMFPYFSKVNATILIHLPGLELFCFRIRETILHFHYTTTIPSFLFAPHHINTHTSRNIHSNSTTRQTIGCEQNQHYYSEGQKRSSTQWHPQVLATLSPI